MVVINNESSSKTYSTIIKYTILWRNFLCDVSNQWNINLSQTSLISWFLSPFHMTEMRIDRATNNFTIVLSELFSFLGEVNDFGWTYKCEIKRVEKEEQPLAFEWIEGNFFELISLTVPCSCFESWRSFSDYCSDDVTGHMIWFWRYDYNQNKLFQKSMKYSLKMNLIILNYANFQF